MLWNLFRDLIQNKEIFLNNVKSGDDFEYQIETYLKWYLKLKKIDNNTFHKINDFKELKNLIQWKLEIEWKIQNTKWKELSWTFVAQPFWTQNYPDFILFYEDYIYILEIKFSKSKNPKPMWNGWFPLNNWIYIFWSSLNKDITFFLGSDVLSNKERQIMINFFDYLKELETKVNIELAKYNINKHDFKPMLEKLFNKRKYQMIQS